MFYYVIILKSSEEELIIPNTWCDELTTFSVLNYGVQKPIKCKVFFSLNENAVADFTKPISADFLGYDACYWAYITKAFSK